jgi:predicted methyltransferase
LLAARDRVGAAVQSSVDLGLTTIEVKITAEGTLLPWGEILPWSLLEKVRETETACFALEDGRPRKAQIYSDFMDRLYSLMPTGRAPTMLVSGIPMHRIKGTDPWQDTLSKVRTIAPLHGRVLDTATGLGYTAIEAARTAELVVTVELDPAVLEICRQNPWSRELFDNSHVEQRIGDVLDEIETFEADSFSRILHDPPAFSLAGELYSGEFYRQLHRVLGRRGRLFHYVGNPESKSGRNVTRGVARRLKEAGFRKVLTRPEAFGLVAYR